LPNAVVDRPLAQRYGRRALAVFTAAERQRFLQPNGEAVDAEQLPWELLYRIEPALYDRLIAGERLHSSILDWLPARCGRVVEVGAGSGRLTLALAPRCEHVAAVEPAAPLRQMLQERIDVAGYTHVDVVPGFFDDLPVAPGSSDLVISCSAFSPRSLRHPDLCLDAMAGCCAAGGLLVLVWPNDVAWLQERGFERVVFDGEMAVEFGSVKEAVELARVFYPHAVEEIARLGSTQVDYSVLGMNPPRDLCWRRCP